MGEDLKGQNKWKVMSKGYVITQKAPFYSAATTPSPPYVPQHQYHITNIISALPLTRTGFETIKLNWYQQI